MCALHTYFPLGVLTGALLFVWSVFRTLIVHDTCLRYALLVFSVTGELIHHFRAYEHALGIRTVAWNNSGSALCVSSFDQTVRVLNSLTWQLESECMHTNDKASGGAVLLGDVSLNCERTSGIGEDAYFDLHEDPQSFSIPTQKVDITYVCGVAKALQ